MADSINIQDYYNLRGTQAQGAADRWLNAVREDAQQKLGKMDPGMRRRVSQQLDRWVAGRYENLLVHEKREVRSGKIAELNTRMAEGAASTASDLIAAARSESRSIAERRDALMATPESDERAKALSDLDDERSEGNTRRIMQLAAETAGREIEWDNAVQEGLFSPEEAKTRAMANRRDTYKMAIEALQTGDEPDAADAIIAALEDEGGETDQETGKRAKGHLAKLCGFTPLDIAGFKEGSKRARMRIDAERKRREAEAARAARDNALAHERDWALDDTLDDAQLSANYASLALDPTLDPTAQHHYASISRQLRERDKAASERAVAALGREYAARREEAQDDAFYAELMRNGPGETPEARIDRATRLYAAGRIDKKQYRKLTERADKQLDAQSQRFVESATAVIRDLVPKSIEWDAENDVAVFRPQKKAPTSATATSLRTGTDARKVLYHELVDALNAAIEWRRARKATEQETWEVFNNIIEGTIDSPGPAARVRQHNIQEALRLVRESTKAYTEARQ